nr:hypothetical protein [Tanacetum cinerariifolium]
MMVQAQEDMGEGSANLTDPHHTPTIIQPSTSQPQKSKQHRKPRRKVTEVPQPSNLTKHVTDEAVNKEMNDSLERAITTATSLDAEKDRGNIFKTQSKVTPNEPGSKGTSLGGGPRCQETIRDTVAQTRRVKKLERRKRSRTYGLKRLYKVRLLARVESYEEERLEVVDDITLAKALNDTKNAKRKADKVVIQEPEKGTTTTTPITITAASSRPKAKRLVIHEQQQAPTQQFLHNNHHSVDIVEEAKEVVDDITLAKALNDTKNAKRKADKVVIQEPEKASTYTTVSSQQPSQVQDKGKGKIGSSKRAREELEQENAKKQKMEDDKESAKLKKCLEIILQFLKKRRKFFAAERAEEKRKRPLTRAQQRSIMCTYLKNIEGWKLKSSKNKSFDNIQEISKSAREELEQENAKKQKMEDDKESAELKQCLEIILGDEDDVNVDATSLSSNSPTIC